MKWKIEIRYGNLDKGQNCQSHMKIIFNVVVKKFTDSEHQTKISVNC